VVPILGGAALLAGLAVTQSGRGRPARIAALAAGAGALAAAVAILRPTCLANPYDALDPFLVQHWLAWTTEARGMIDGLRAGDAQSSLAVAVSVLTAGALPLILGRRALIVSALILLSLAVSLYQVRGLLMLTIMQLIALPALVAAALARVDAARARRVGIAAAIGIGAGVAVVVGFGPGSDRAEAGPSVAASDGDVCTAAGALDGLSAQPVGMVAAMVNAGTAILLATEHSTLAAPYHRNQDGLTALFRAVLAEEDAEAERVLRAAGVDYVAICTKDPVLTAIGRVHGPVFGERLRTGATPAFLEPLPEPEGSATRLFRLRPAQS
jgi:hypothetical protein